MEAYDLSRFMAQPSAGKPPRSRARVRVAKPRTPSHFGRMVRVLLTVSLLVALMCGVLYTRAGITDMQTQIATAESQLDEEEALHAYLTFELENMSTQRNIEKRAEELGLVKMNSNQLVYVRVDEGNTIEVKESPLARMFKKTQNGLLSVMDYLSPEASNAEEAE